MIRTAILTYNQAAFFELGCALELFALPRPEFKDWYQTEVVSFSEGPFQMMGGLTMEAKQVKSLNKYDLLIVPSWPMDQSELPAKLATAVLKFHQDGKRILSFCSGAFLLGELGILSQRHAITHWRYGEKFKSKYPNAQYVEDVLYVFDGQIGCSAGSSAAIDLGIEVIRQDFGFQVANKVARRLVLSAHRKGGQSQFADTPVVHHTDQFAQALDWAITNLSSSIDITTLATKANMSRRTFDRKFRANFNISPKEWLTFQRIQYAKEMLEEYDFSVEKIAELSGFDNGTTMRHHFRKELGVSPNQYRGQFRKVNNKSAV